MRAIDRTVKPLLNVVHSVLAPRLTGVANPLPTLAGRTALNAALLLRAERRLRARLLEAISPISDGGCEVMRIGSVMDEALLWDEVLRSGKLEVARAGVQPISAHENTPSATEDAGSQTSPEL